MDRRDFIHGSIATVVVAALPPVQVTRLLIFTIGTKRFVMTGPEAARFIEMLNRQSRRHCYG